MDSKTFIDITKGTLSDGIELGLNRIKTLLEILGNPQNNIKIIHVAGTNGKGSCSAMLASILKSEGYKTGLFTSPHLLSYNENFTINGENISDKHLASLIKKIKPLTLTMNEKPTEFELMTAIALLYFKEECCDFVILEVGLGGKLDSTNVITSPLLSVITKIGLDHTKYLGNTIEKIAYEKAGIIKNKVPCILMSQCKEVENIIKSICLQSKSTLYISEPKEIKALDITIKDSTFNYKNISNLTLPLVGTHQIENATLVLKIIEVLQTLGVNISNTSVKNGFINTQWPGRFEIVDKSPLFIVDGAHNIDGINTLTSTIGTLFKGQKLIFIIAVMKDKDYKNMISKLVPYAHSFIAVSPNTSRALNAKELHDCIKSYFKGNVYHFNNIQEAVCKAYEISNKNPICYCGSLYVVGKIKSAVQMLNQ